MSHAIWFDVALLCRHCGVQSSGKQIAMYTADMLPDPGDQWLQIGDSFCAEPEDFPEAYFRMREPSSATDYIALEQWGCPACHTVQWARIAYAQTESEAFQLLSVDSLELSRENLQSFNFITRKSEDGLDTKLEPDNLLAVFKDVINK